MSLGESVTVCFRTPMLLADLFVLSPGYEVPLDLATVPQPFSMHGLRSRACNVGLNVRNDIAGIVT